MSKGEDEKCSTGTPSQESPNAPSEDVKLSYEELMLGVMARPDLKGSKFFDVQLPMGELLFDFTVAPPCHL